MKRIDSRLESIISELKKIIMSQENRSNASVNELKSSSLIRTSPLINVVNGYDNYAYEDRRELTAAPVLNPAIENLPPSEIPCSSSITTFGSMTLADESDTSIINHLASIDDINLKVANNNQFDESILRESKNSYVRSDAIDLSSPPRTPDNGLKFICLERESTTINYGFLVKSFLNKKTHFISVINEDSLASEKGLKQGDKMLEVNGESVTDLNHKEIVSKMLTNPLRLNLTVKSDLSLFLSHLEEQNEIFKNQEIKKIEATVPLIYHLTLQPDDFDGFGLHFRNTNKSPHFITKVDSDSPAERAGLKKGLILNRINERDLTFFPNEKISNILNGAKAKGTVKLEILCPQMGMPRLCFLDTKSDKLGFHLVGARTYKGAFKISNVKDGSAAQVAGIQENDFIIEVNGKSLAMSTYDDTMNLIKKHKSEGELSLLVADRTTWFRINNIAFPQKVYKPFFKRCTVELSEGEKSFGFKLFTDPIVKPKHMIFAVDPRSAAFSANLRETDVVLEINDKNVRRLKKASVNKMIRKSLEKGRIEVLAIENTGYNHFKKRNKRVSSKNLQHSSTLNFFSEPRENNLPLNTDTEEILSCDNPPVPRLCSLNTQTNKKLGFNVMSCTTKKGIIRLNGILPGSVAAESGLQENDFVIEICGKVINEMDAAEVVNLVEEQRKANDLNLLVVDRAALDWYEARKIPITSLMSLKKSTTEAIAKSSQEASIDSTPETVVQNAPTVTNEITSSAIHKDMRRNVSFETAPGPTNNEVNYDYLEIIIKRAPKQPLGLALSMKEGTISNKRNKKTTLSVPPYITKINPGGLAETSGLKVNDIILKVNNKETTGKSNKIISKWFRDSKKITLNIRRVTKMDDHVITEEIESIDNEQIEDSKETVNTTPGESIACNQSEKDGGRL